MRNFTCSFIAFLFFFCSGTSGQGIEPQRQSINQSIVARSMPFFVKRKQSKKFHYKEAYRCRKPLSITIEAAKSPIWFAIKALPSLIDEQNGSTEQVLNAFFANSVTLYLLNKEVGLDVLMAYWEKEPGNKPENEMHRKIGHLFDTVAINQRMGDEITKLQQSQLPDGSWPWFAGMKGNRYITQLICTGIGRLYNLHIYDKYSDRLNDLGVKAFNFLDNQMANDYEDMVSKKENLKDNHLTSAIIAYLYARTFWNVPVELNGEKALYYWQEQGWNHYRSRSLLEQARLVSAFYRQGEDTVYIKMFRTIDSEMVHTHNGDVYWKENSGNATQKIETQAMLLEGYNIMRFPAPETETLEGMKQWLLRWKQRDRWANSTATVNAIYALLQNDDDSVITNNFPKMTAGNNLLDVTAGQGSGYWYHVWHDKEITTKLSRINVQNDTDTTAWVDITMEYRQKKAQRKVGIKGIAPIKQVYFLTKGAGSKWALLSKKTELKPGDSLKVNLIIKTSKDIDYVHIQSPVDDNAEQSAHREEVQIRDGLSIEKNFGGHTADFYIEKLKTGEYTFSYKLVVTEKGPFENGKVIEVERVYE